jgi:CO/xanthine dehydrogenase Mo-binding subunit
MGVGMALHENLVYDARSGQPLTAGFYYDRIPTPHGRAGRRRHVR